jgi:hypothetical protein
MINSQIPEILKQAAFEAYTTIHTPAGMDLNACTAYDGATCCLDRDVIPCPPCETYERLATEFNAIAVG